MGDTDRGAERAAPPKVFPSQTLSSKTIPSIRRVSLRGGLHTRVTSILACFRTLRSDLGAPRSVMTSCRADVGTMIERLRRPNLLESLTATVGFQPRPSRD